MKSDISKLMAARSRSLRHISRKFPKFAQGMAVAEYCEQYQQLNNGKKLGTQMAHVLPFDLSTLHHPAAVLDGPEVVEETV